MGVVGWVVVGWVGVVVGRGGGGRVGVGGCRGVVGGVIRLSF